MNYVYIPTHNYMHANKRVRVHVLSTRTNVCVCVCVCVCECVCVCVCLCVSCFGMCAFFSCQSCRIHQCGGKCTLKPMYDQAPVSQQRHHCAEYKHSVNAISDCVEKRL